MSKNSFKVRKGLTLSPVDPSEIINPEAGDLIADSTDDNKIKRYDATSADWASVGGSAGIGGNLMAEFEKLTPDLVNVTSAVDTVTFLPIDDNNKSIKATFSGSVGSIQFQAPIDSSLHEIQGTVSVWIRTSVQNLQVSSVQDGVKLSTLPVSATNKWKQYELPVVIGGTEMGFIVESLTGVTGDVYIDQPFVGLTPSSYGFEVAQAEYLGNVKYIGTAGCNWLVSSSTFSNFSADNDCATPTSTGRVQPPLTKIPAIVLPAGSPAGTYQFIAKAMFYKGSGVTQYAGFRFSDGTNHSSGVNNLYLTGQTLGSIEGSITYSSPLTVDTTINIQGYTLGGNVEVYASNNSGDMAIDAFYYPPKTTIVTQTQEETVETANEFSAKISATGVVTDQNLPWINGNCSISATSQFICTFNTGIFTVAPNCSVSTTGSNRTGNLLNPTTVTTLTAETGIADTSGFYAIAQAWEVICQKQGADYNKSRLIVGQFEQIKSTELVKFSGSPSVNYSIANGGSVQLDADIVQYDNYNAYDAANNRYVIPKTSLYHICASAGVTISGTGGTVGLFIRENGNDRSASYQYGVGGRPTFPTTCKTISLNEGAFITYHAYQDSGATSSGSTAISLTYLTIDEVPDTAAIVKNLNDNRNVKCQTKFLASDQTASPVAIATFSGLDLSKKYSIEIKGRHTDSNVISNVSFIARNNSQIVSLCRSATADTAQVSCYTRDIFKPTVNNLVVTAEFNPASGITVQGDGTVQASFIRLCELPDNYIETDEW